MKNGSYVAYNKGKKGLYKPTQETLEKYKRRPKPIGEKNGMYGKIFITDGIINREIKDGDNITEGWRKGVTRKSKII